MSLPLSISIVACNEEKNLERCLRSAEGMAREIVVVDSGSRDETVAVAQRFGARVIHQDWLGYRDQKNFALKQCREEWVLALDCDEELSIELRKNLEAFFSDGQSAVYDGVQFNRKVWFLGRWIKHGDWYPDTKLRLFRREKAVWGGSPEHDYIELQGCRLWVSGDLHHYSFPSINRYVDKINGFADVFLERQIEAGKNWSLATNLFRPWWRFFRAYVIRRGFLDGFPGFWIAVATAFSAFIRYSRKYEEEVKLIPSQKE